MAYTSEQYKYLLVQRLRRHLSMNNDAERLYTQTFFAKLFDDTITITEDDYNRFVDLMDQEMQFCSDNGITSDESITSEMISTHGMLLTEAFAAIGIELIIAETYDASGRQIGGDATFTKPNGEVMVYEVRGGWYASDKNRFQICAQARIEYEYAKASAKYYNFRDKIPLKLSDYNLFRAGPDTYWTYDEDISTMSITGDGTLVTIPTDPQIGAGKFLVVTIGANVSKIAKNALNLSEIKAIVLWQASDSNLALEESVLGSYSDIWTLDIYCDNKAFRNYENFPKGLIIRWHTLDEWRGLDQIPEPNLFYYNGVLLPEFKSNSPSTSPYLVIGIRADGQYMGMTSASPKTLAAGSTTLGTSLLGSYWLHITGAYLWDHKSGSYTSQKMTPIWANYDILNADGTTFLEASEPVPIYKGKLFS